MSQTNNTLDKIRLIIDKKSHLFLNIGFITIPCLLYITRAWQYIINPQLYAEDGAVWLADAYNHGVKSLFSPYNGFAHTAERIWALFVTMFPLRFAPFLFDFGGFFIFALFCFYLFSNRLNILTNNYQKLFVALSLGLIANFGEFFFNFSNSIFLLGLIGLCIYLAKPSSSPIVRILEKILFVVTCLTLPFAWFYLVIATFDYIWRKQRRIFFIAASAIGSLIQVLVHHFSIYQRQDIPLSTLATSKYTLIEFYNQIITPAFRFARIDISTSIPFHEVLVLFIFSVLLLCTLLYVVIKHAPLNLKFIIFFLAVFTMSAFLGPLVGGNLSPINILKFMDTAQFGNRYFFYGILAMILITGLTTSIYIKKQALYGFLLLFIIFGVFTSVSNSDLRVNKGFVNYSSVYTKGVNTLGQLKSGKIEVIPENPVGWSINLKTKN
ncbi:MAG TPA: hypothetical protein VMR76_01210 [Candidatus Saccharimonadia bacterium]|nr:hypothetical protein [Candidatus Saccharimonadia bacterium]